MGLFSSSYKTYVSSSVWNLAGEFEDRPALMPSLILSATLSGSGESISKQVQSSLLNSTAQRGRAFFRWARNNYSLGMPEGTVSASMAVRGSAVKAELSTLLGVTGDPNKKLKILAARVDDGEAEYWAENWILRNHPDLSEEDWDVDFDPNTTQITVNYSGSGSVQFPASLDLLWALLERGRKLLYITYQIRTKNSVGLWDASDVSLFTYRMGEGNAVFDALRPISNPMPEFYPILPLRLNNQSLRDMDQDLQDEVTKGFKYLTGRKPDEVLDTIEDHDDVDDMDHVFMVPGVSLNTPDPVCKEYLYKFFNQLKERELVDFDAEQFLENSINDAENYVRWGRWERANGGEFNTYTNPFRDGDINLSVGSAVLTYGASNTNRVSIKMDGMDEFHFEITWGSIKEFDRPGNAKRYDGQARPKAKLGEYWIAKLPVKDLVIDLDYMRDPGQGPNREPRTTRIGIFHQYAKRRYRFLEITNLRHVNYVYGDKTVRIDAYEALEDEEESGFIMPLHYPTVQAMGMLDNVKLSNATCYLVVNSYTRVKQKWYQKGFFKLVLVVASIALSWVTGGGSLAAAGGLLGGNVAVGLAVGATAATAALVGAVVNGIAGVIITTLLSKAAVAFAGEKWGAIIATLATFVAFQIGGHYAATGNFNVDWGSMFRIDNLMDLTNSVSGLYNQYLAGDTMEIYEQMSQLQKDQADALEKIREMTDDVLGVTNIAFDPMLLTDATEHFGERSEAFLGRTLLTGSDLAELSHEMVHSFAELTLELPGAF